MTQETESEFDVSRLRPGDWFQFNSTGNRVQVVRAWIESGSVTNNDREPMDRVGVIVYDLGDNNHTRLTIRRNGYVRSNPDIRFISPCDSPVAAPFDASSLRVGDWFRFERSGLRVRVYAAWDEGSHFPLNVTRPTEQQLGVIVYQRPDGETRHLTTLRDGRINPYQDDETENFIVSCAAPPPAPLPIDLALLQAGEWVRFTRTGWRVRIVEPWTRYDAEDRRLISEMLQPGHLRYEASDGEVVTFHVRRDGTQVPETGSPNAESIQLIQHDVSVAAPAAATQENTEPEIDLSTLRVGDTIMFGTRRVVHRVTQEWQIDETLSQYSRTRGLSDIGHLCFEMEDGDTSEVLAVRRNGTAISDTANQLVMMVSRAVEGNQPPHETAEPIIDMTRLRPGESFILASSGAVARVLSVWQSYPPEELPDDDSSPVGIVECLRDGETVRMTLHIRQDGTAASNGVAQIALPATEPGNDFDIADLDVGDQFQLTPQSSRARLVTVTVTTPWIPHSSDTNSQRPYEEQIGIVVYSYDNLNDLVLQVKRNGNSAIRPGNQIALPVITAESPVQPAFDAVSLNVGDRVRLMVPDRDEGVILATVDRVWRAIDPPADAMNMQAVGYMQARLLGSPDVMHLRVRRNGCEEHSDIALLAYAPATDPVGTETDNTAEGRRQPPTARSSTGRDMNHPAFHSITPEPRQPQPSEIDLRPPQFDAMRLSLGSQVWLVKERTTATVTSFWRATELMRQSAIMIEPDYRQLGKISIRTEAGESSWYLRRGGTGLDHSLLMEDANLVRCPHCCGGLSHAALHQVVEEAPEEVKSYVTQPFSRGIDLSNPAHHV